MLKPETFQSEIWGESLLLPQALHELAFEVQHGDLRIFEFSKKIGSAPDGHHNVSKTKVNSNVTPRGRSEVFLASTRSKNNYSLFVIWHCRECGAPPPTNAWHKGLELRSWNFERICQIFWNFERVRLELRSLDLELRKNEVPKNLELRSFEVLIFNFRKVTIPSQKLRMFELFAGNFFWNFECSKFQLFWNFECLKIQWKLSHSKFQNLQNFERNFWNFEVWIWNFETSKFQPLMPGIGLRLHHACVGAACAFDEKGSWCWFLRTSRRGAMHSA